MASASDIMTKRVVVVNPNDSVAHLRNIFMKKKVSSALVFDDRPVGIATEKDLAQAFFEERRPIDEILVKSIMTKEILSAEPDTDVRDVAKIMANNRTAKIPVISDGRIYGIITKTDMARHFSENYRGLASVESLSKTPLTLREFHTVFKAARMMNLKNEGRIVVMRDNKPAGIISERDISMASFGMRPSEVMLIRKKKNGMAHRHIKVYPITVGDLMRTNIESIAGKEDASKAASKMLDREVGSLLVKDGSEYGGIITKRELIKYIAKK